jgi:hypothetical protein
VSKEKKTLCMLNANRIVKFRTVLLSTVANRANVFGATRTDNTRRPKDVLLAHKWQGDCSRTIHFIFSKAGDGVDGSWPCRVGWLRLWSPDGSRHSRRWSGARGTVISVKSKALLFFVGREHEEENVVVVREEDGHQKTLEFILTGFFLH